MSVTRPAALRARLLFLCSCAILLTAGCGGDDTATTSNESSVDTSEAPSISGEPVAGDLVNPEPEPVAVSEVELGQAEPDSQTVDSPDDFAAQADKEEFEPGFFLGTAGEGRTKVKLVLLESGGIEQFVNGKKMETIQVFETSKVKWTIIGQHVQLTLPNLDAVFYRIEDPDTIVGPVARVSAGGLRETTAASTRVVFKRGSGSTVAISDDPGIPAERPVGNTAVAQPPVNAKVGLEVGNLAPEIIGEDIDGKKFKLSDYRGKVVMLDFWGDW